MKTHKKCFPCFEKQAKDACTTVGLDKGHTEEVLQAVRDLMASFPLGRSPVAMAAQIHERVRTASGVEDPYSEVKRDSNRACREAMPVLSQIANWSLNRLETGVRLAIAGSFIDSGANRVHGLNKLDVIRSAQSALTEPLAGDSVAELEKLLRGARQILYVGDNAGECFLDTFLLDRIPNRNLTYAVRGAPVLNDATVHDAMLAGIHRRCKLVDTGDDAPGVLLDRCSDDFRATFDRSDLLILKGQGNYESLSDIRGKQCVFLTRVKCEVFAEDIGYPVGSNVVDIRFNAEGEGSGSTPAGQATAGGTGKAA